MRLFAVTALGASLVAAVPAAWDSTVEKYYAAVGKDYNSALAARGFPSLPQLCDLSKAKQPTSDLAPPTGLQLTHVAIGRGVQNYTCAGLGDSDPPAQVGALATLYNASCIAAIAPTILNILPDLFLEFVPAQSSVSDVSTSAATAALSRLPSTLSFGNGLISGHHYFDALGTPFFNLLQPLNIGDCYGAKTGTFTAPKSNPPAVPWLRLDAKQGYSGQSVNIKTVFRLVTAGGVAPATCKGQPDNISVQYAAQYWFYE